jgi:RNA polymerase sigma factor (sigma-70 family)
MLNEHQLPGLSQQSREEAFTKRYPQLLAWALRLTNQHRALAEDLVQDAFIQFTRARTSLDDIENLNGYLRRMLRNMNLSRLSRTAEQMQERTVSIAEQELLQLASDSTELQRHLQTREELHRICEYACKRKESSRAGSVLILRFFLEYSPIEIAQVLCCSRHCVDQWQRFARREIKLYLEHPSRLKFVTAKSAAANHQVRPRNARVGLAEELRDVVFNSCSGECLEPAELKEIYLTASEETLTSEKVGHIVSCDKCLDEVNAILGLPLLAERYQADPPSSRPKPPGASGGGRDDGPTDLSGKFAKRLSEVVEHEPKELRICVNSIPVGSLTVSDSNEVCLNLAEDEEITFIEIFSEQDVRLLFFALPETGADETEQWAEIELSDRRVLKVILDSFNGRSLRVNYSTALAPALSIEKPRLKTGLARISEFISAFLSGKAWVTPAMVTAIIAAIVIGTMFFWRPARSSKELLAQASQRESVVALTTADVVHRTLLLQERNAAGKTISSHRIETWQDSLGRRRVQRVFDETNQLIAGAWEQADGSRTIYHHGAPLLRDQAHQLLLDGDTWRIDLSATQFNSLIGSGGATQLQESETNYVIRWDGETGPFNEEPRLIMATLTLDRTSLTAVKLVLRVKRGTELREYQFTETAGERINSGNVPTNVFSIDEVSSPVLLRSKDQFTKHPFPNATVSKTRSSVASTELEVELEHLLYQAKEDRSEQIALTRTSDGYLHIEGVVDSNARRSELLKALDQVRGNPLVKIHLQTVGEAIRTKATATERSVARTVEDTPDLVPMDRALREYFTTSRHLSSNDLDGAVRNFSSSVVNRAYRGLFHAIELNRLVNRFSDIQLQTMSPDARAKWLQMIRAHVKAFDRETTQLITDLELVLPNEAESAFKQESSITSDAQLRSAVERLHKNALTTNTAIGAAFTTSSNGSTAGVKAKEFWRSLLMSKQLAEQISRYQD